MKGGSRGVPWKLLSGRASISLDDVPANKFLNAEIVGSVCCTIILKTKNITWLGC